MAFRYRLYDPVADPAEGSRDSRVNVPDDGDGDGGDGGCRSQVEGRKRNPLLRELRSFFDLLNPARASANVKK